MQEFRKNPVTIQAAQWAGGASAATPIIDWILTHGGTATWMEEHVVDEGLKTEHTVPEKLTIRTLEGYIDASPGDFIIRGVQGEFYPCKPDIFAETYTHAAAPVRVELGHPVVFTEEGRDVLAISTKRAKRDGFYVGHRAAEVVYISGQEWVHPEDGESIA